MRGENVLLLGEIVRVALVLSSLLYSVIYLIIVGPGSRGRHSVSTSLRRGSFCGAETSGYGKETQR